MGETKAIDLYEFLVEAELQQYYNSIKTELKITSIVHLKYATDEDLRQVCGLSRPEIRRLRKYYEKYYPHGYFNKIKRLLQPPLKKDESNANHQNSVEVVKVATSPSKIPNNKHIIPADSITVNKQLGTGEFGIVQQGVWTNGSERIQVAIKCLCRERMQSNPMEFLKEAAIMHAIEHENIVRLYGVVLDTDSLMLVTELAHLRSLLECLKDPGLRVSFLTIPTLCEFASQICNGMMYLENKRLIHRDLAARNILVFSKNKVKISDFGLSRALGVGKDYYQTNFNINLKLPIAWCAPECINFLRFTNASDVWAYGVCLWEIFSYGFQPWAALTGHQILEAIDEPNYQRLEKPECCPKEYYSLMAKCWAHDALKRPKFSEIYQLLPDLKPEQLKTVVAYSEQKKDYLLYRQGEIITVLDKSTNSPYWKGVLNSGKTGLFNPANTVAHIDSLPSAINRDTFSRASSDRCSSKRKIRTDMISGPQNDLKHTGHVGIDGAYFGDVAFLASPQNLPRQIVTPYKPSEDLEQTPLLLPPTPTSPDSIHTASGYFPETLQTGHQGFINLRDVQSNLISDGQTDSFHTAFDFRNTGFKDSNPFINSDVKNDNVQKPMKEGKSDSQDPHEYHEISDDDIPDNKVFDLGPSLMDEMDYMFKSITTISEQPPLSPDVENTNKRNELTEMNSKLNRKNSSSSGVNSTKGVLGGKSKKKSGTVKPISVKDEKLLNHAIEIANEISAKSMTDLVSDTNTTMSPKRKFSFKFPNINHSNDKDGHRPATASLSHNTNTLSSAYKEKRNFSEEAKNVPDLQSTITEEQSQAYNNLVGNSSSALYGPDLKSFTASTLPRSRFNSLSSFKQTSLDLNSPPKMPAPKSPEATTPEQENPLRMLRSKNFPVVKPRLKIVTQSNTSLENGVDKDSNCESPSYLTSPEYSYNENDVNRVINGHSASHNPIPLPPRDRSKATPLNQKRHVRKHPLIIPGTGVQRTLNRVTQATTPVDDKTDLFSLSTYNNDDSVNLDTNLLQKSSSDSSKLNHCHSNNNNDDHDDKVYTKGFMENNFPNNHRDLSKDPTYENLEIYHSQYNHNYNVDTASLDCESILENDMDKNCEMSSPSSSIDIVDGFAVTTNKLVDDVLRNVDITNHKSSVEKNKLTQNGNDELEDNLHTGELKKSINYVSCEDLLEFAEKPKGRARGLESDEVRIMAKILGKDIPPEQCLVTLDFIDWDIYKAIKLCKLQKILPMLNLSLQECTDVLEEYDWDIYKTIENLQKQYSTVLQRV